MSDPKNTATGTATINDEDAVIEAQRAKAVFHFSEDIAPGLRLDMDLNRIFHSTHSPYQKIDVIETYFGKTLITDGKTQSTQFDEFAYHESLVHPSLLKSALLASAADGDAAAAAAHHVPRTVFIGGGGELATAREVLRHKSVERVVMVDLDPKVVDVSKRYLPEWGGEAVATNSRLDLIIGDAHAYLLNTDETFDVIIMDISDPIEAGPGIMLYTKEFYRHALTRLNKPHGVFVTQAGTADSIPPPHSMDGEQDTACFGPIQNTLNTVFDCVVPYSTNIPSFGSDWGFVMAFNVPEGSEMNAKQMMEDWCGADSKLIDGLIAKRITHLEGVVGARRDSNGKKKKDDVDDDDDEPLRYYDGITHRNMFNLTKPLRKSLKNDTRIMTEDNPIFMY